MKINSDPAQVASAEPPNSPSNQAKSERASTASFTASSVESDAMTSVTNPVTPVQRNTDVTFRRDSNGRIYYVVSDAQSGEEILEVPTKSVRDVSQGIEDYLKQTQSKSSSHVKTKA
jgi:uncharacterized FlaG/YvyC family protein